MIGILLTDNRLSREGLRALMTKRRNDCEIKGEASDGDEALRKLEELKPDILLTDIETGRTNGIELTRQVETVSPGTRVIIYSMQSGESQVLAALRAGARGYILKTASFDELNQALHKVHAGSYFLSDYVLEMVIRYYMDHDSKRRSRLTSREREVLLLVKDGLTASEIARRLGISHRTAEAHRFHAMKKLSLRNHAELLRFAISGNGEEQDRAPV